jgi:hypothetical protein
MSTGIATGENDVSNPEVQSNKDASNGYVGLTALKINFKNVANTFTSFFTNSNTASRTYTFQDKNGTVAHTSDIVDASSKTTPVDADQVGLIDSAASNVLKNLSWANAKATLKTYFDTLYVGVSASSRVVQTVYFSTGTVDTTTVTIPLDNSIPQNNEGKQFMSLSITPTSSSNKLCITVQMTCAHTAAVVLIGALFRDSTVNALQTTWESVAAGQAASLFLYYEVVAGSTSTTTLRAVAGGHAAGTTTFNGSASTGFFGGTMNSFMKIEERIP